MKLTKAQIDTLLYLHTVDGRANWHAYLPTRLFASVKVLLRSENPLIEELSGNGPKLPWEREFRLTPVGQEFLRDMWKQHARR